MLVLAVSAALVGLGQPVQAGPAVTFILSPSELTFATFTSGEIVYADATVTNTGRRPLALVNPSTATPTPPAGSFWDTQGGSCWQAYESLGQPIPPGTSCTIQVGFAAPTDPFAGHASSSLVVTQCLGWGFDKDYGFIVCKKTGGSLSVPLQAEMQLPS